MSYLGYVPFVGDNDGRKYVAHIMEAVPVSGRLALGHDVSKVKWFSNTELHKLIWHCLQKDCS